MTYFYGLLRVTDYDGNAYWASVSIRYFGKNSKLMKSTAERIVQYAKYCHEQDQCFSLLRVASILSQLDYFHESESSDYTSFGMSAEIDDDRISILVEWIRPPQTKDEYDVEAYWQSVRKRT